MDDSVIPTAAAEVRDEDAGMDVGGASVPTNGHGAVPPTPVAPTSRRRLPSWALVLGGLMVVVVAFGAGYAINAGEAEGVRDDLTVDLHRVEKELDSVEGTQAATSAALDQCRDAFEGATALAASADDVAEDWQEFMSLAAQWAAAAPGSAEEAAIDAEMLDLQAQLFAKVGSLSASADRVTTDRESCGAS